MIVISSDLTNTEIMLTDAYETQLVRVDQNVEWVGTKVWEVLRAAPKPLVLTAKADLAVYLLRYFPEEIDIKVEFEAELKYSKGGNAETTLRTAATDVPGVLKMRQILGKHTANLDGLTLVIKLS